MALVKFYRGVRAKYNETTHIDGIYFALDTHEIIVNGDAFGYYSADHKEITTVEFTAPDIITITYANGESDTVTLQTAEAGETAEQSKAGIISKEHIYKLSKIEDGAQVNVIEKVKVDGVEVSVQDKEVDIDLTPLKDTIKKQKVVAGDTSVTIVEETEGTKVSVKVKPGGSINVTETGLEVDQSALTEYVGDNEGIKVTEVPGENKKKINLILNPREGNILSATTDGAYASVKLKKLEVGPEETTIASRYGLVGIQADGTEITISGPTIDIIKDKFLKNVELGTIPAEQPNAGDDALIFTFNLEDGSTKTEYVNLSTFLREAEAGNGIEFITGDDQVKRYTIKISAASEKDSSAQPYLVVDETGLKLVGLNAELEAIKTLAKQWQTEVEEKTTGHVLVTVTTEADGHKKVVISETDIASAEALEALIKRVEDLEDKRELSDYWAEPDNGDFPEAEDLDWNMANQDDWAEED